MQVASVEIINSNTVEWTADTGPSEIGTLGRGRGVPPNANLDTLYKPEL